MCLIKVLVNAYACCPDMGSEQGMAWKWISNLAKYCELYVITEDEYHEQNENTIKKFPWGKNIHFYYIPVPDKVRQMCWNQGDWRFYIHYARWQKKAMYKARQIIDSVQIDVMHQLNMAGFREPGMLYKINEERIQEGKKRIPLIWGPIAGYGTIPLSFMKQGGIGFIFFYLLKNFLNLVQMKWHPRVRKMTKSSDALLACMPEIQDALMRFHGMNSFLVNETGCDVHESNDNTSKTFFKNGKFRILWVGRFMFTKQLPLALRVISEIRDIDGLEFHVVGKGFNDKETENAHRFAQDLGIDDICRWHGQIPNKEVHQLMRESDIFFFTSIFEATSTVILEAIGNNLPVVCFNRCGFGPIIDERIGRKISCSTPRQAISDFSEVIRNLYQNKEILPSMSNNCSGIQQELNWHMKIEKMISIYRNFINKNNGE